METYLIDEFLADRKPGIQIANFERFDKVEEFVKSFKNGIYSSCYKYEPPYPYLWVRLENNSDGDRKNQSYCYYAK